MDDFWKVLLHVANTQNLFLDNHSFETIIFSHQMCTILFKIGVNLNIDDQKSTMSSNF
jgi:hypothetical protein